jgi:hypothetical protein
MFYRSATGASLADDETGLYGQSALYIFSLFNQEWEEKAQYPHNTDLTSACLAGQG